MDIESAIAIALEAHQGQKDLDGEPVILHPLAVAMSGKSREEFIAGILHDVVEDSHFTFDDLLARGIDKTIVEALQLITHQKNTPYPDYIAKVIASGNALAIATKMADLAHNISRNDRATEQKQRVYQKHLQAYQMIEKALNS